MSLRWKLSVDLSFASIVIVSIITYCHTTHLFQLLFFRYFILTKTIFYHQLSQEISICYVVFTVAIICKDNIDKNLNYMLGPASRSFSITSLMSLKLVWACISSGKNRLSLRLKFILTKLHQSWQRCVPRKGFDTRI